MNEVLSLMCKFTLISYHVRVISVYIMSDGNSAKNEAFSSAEVSCFFCLTADDCLWAQVKLRKKLK